MTIRHGGDEIHLKERLFVRNTFILHVRMNKQPFRVEINPVGIAAAGQNESQSFRLPEFP